MIVQQPVIISTPTAAVASMPVAALPQIMPGTQVTVSADNLGETAGQAAIRVNELTLPVEVVSWTAESVTLQIPTMSLSRTTPAQLAVIRADGTLARTLDVELSAGVMAKL